MGPETKRCSKCKTVKGVEEFARHRNRADGRQSWCKACDRAVQATDESRAKARARKRRHYKRNAEAERERFRQWRAQNPEKKKAQNAVRSLVKAGKLERGRCSITFCEATAEFHHPDYAKPLSVIPLCRPHHRQLDAGRVGIVRPKVIPFGRWREAPYSAG